MSLFFDPIPRRASRWRTLKEHVGECGHCWTTDLEEAHVHRCTRFHGHRSAHCCNCGARRKEERVLPPQKRPS